MSDPFDDARLADSIEAAAWRDMYAAAPAALGLHVRDLGDGLLVTATQLPVTQFNRVWGLGSKGPVSEATLDEALAALRGRESFVHVSPYAEALDAMLTRRGLGLAPRATWAKMLRATEAGITVESPLSIREVGREHAVAMADAIGTAHGIPPPVRVWIAALVGRPNWHAFAAFDRDAVVGGAFVFIDGERSWLGLGGTIPSHRRMRAQQALIAARIRHAHRLGCTVVATETGEPIADEPNHSLSNMYRCGFRKVAARKNYLLRA